MHRHQFRLPFRRSVLPAAVAAVCASPLALFAQPSATATVTELPEVRVTATRADQIEENVAGTVTAITADQAQRRMARDVRDLLRHEPGVSVRREPFRAGAALGATGRGGNEGINIRGLEGNQVLLQTDGVRLPAAFSIGPFRSGRGDYLEVEGYKKVEVLRGPASTLYGSDGLGGAVSFITKDVVDLLDPGQTQGFGLRSQYSSVNAGWLVSPSAAMRTEHFEAMVLGAFRRGHEESNQARDRSRNANRTAPNPQDQRSNYLLAKLAYLPDTVHRIGLTLEQLDRRTETTVYSGIAVPPLTPSSVTGLDTRDTIRRDRLSLDYRYTDAEYPYFQLARIDLRHQDARNRQFSDERRNTAPDRTRDNRYMERLWGGSAQFESSFGSTVTHRLIYGLDYDTLDVRGTRGGTVPPMGEAYPIKAFPDTEYTLFGAFVLDEIQFGSVLLIPGMRYDRFKLDARRSDAAYAGSTPVSLSGSALSPRLGVVWKAYPMASPYVQYSFGFRAPTPNNVNDGFTNLNSPFNAYVTVSNPDLKPERSRSLEVGLRGERAGLQYRVSAYANRYRDFIEERALVGGAGTPADPRIFQSINLTRATIRGFELAAQWQFQPEWALRGSYARSRGESRQNAESAPLMTIDPAKLVLGLEHTVEGRYGAELLATMVERKKRPHDPTRFTPKGFTVFDFNAHYHLTPAARLNVGVFNLFDRKYYLWSDTRAIAADSTVREAFSQAGRNFAISLDYRF